MVGCALLCATVHAATTKGTVILLRALAYDRGFDDRVQGPVDVVILYRESVAESKACMTQELASQAEITIPLRGHEIRLAALDLATSTLEVAKDKELWFVCPGLDDDLPLIVSEAAKAKKLTASQSRAYVEKGIVLGVDEGATETDLYLNLASSKAVGAEFNSQLLQHVTIIK
jgi:hypothetical protein